jgi:hypothetical protein
VLSRDLKYLHSTRSEDGKEKRAMTPDVIKRGSTAPPQSLVSTMLKPGWEDPKGRFRLRDDLRLVDLAKSQFLANTRLFLTTLAESDGADATAGGNLNRGFVKKICHEMIGARLLRKSLLSICKVINETDFRPLHLVRLVSEAAGLVVRRKRRFQLTKTGQELLAPDQAGLLFRTLFIACFHNLKLHYNSHFPEVPEIQENIPVILWRISKLLRQWIPVRGLPRRVLSPEVLSQVRSSLTPQFDSEEWILCVYVLDPLVDLGLITKKKSHEWRHVTDKDVVRLTPLWGKFISFRRSAKLRK